MLFKHSESVIKIVIQHSLVYIIKSITKNLVYITLSY